MSKNRTNKKSKHQRSREELSEAELGSVSGGVAAPRLGDERPTESITFVYGKLGTADLASITVKK
jgi:hypothetical protein